MNGSFQQLLFYPSDAAARPWATTDLVALLTELGFIGQPVDPACQRRYFIGDSFLQQVSFMGCSPALAFQSAEAGMLNWQEFTFVAISGPLQQTHCLVNRQMARPVCPHCHKRHRPEQIETAQELVCPHCQHSAEIAAWDWREFGGCARQFIAVVNAWPKEAIPADSFMDTLGEKTDMEWRYCYVTDVIVDTLE